MYERIRGSYDDALYESTYTLLYCTSCVGRINEVSLYLTRLVLGWVTTFTWANDPGIWPAPRPAQSPTLSGTENQYWPKCSDALWLGGKAGWLIPLVDKTCGWHVKLWSLVNMYHPEHLKDEYLYKSRFCIIYYHNIGFSLNGL